MGQYTGRQRSYEEAVKFFTGGSKKYGPSRYNPRDSRDNPRYMANLEERARRGRLQRKFKKKMKLEPQEPRKGDRTVVFFGDASVSNIRGMYCVQSNKYLYRQSSNISQEIPTSFKHGL